ncbi:MAG: phosphoglycerate dehydrogenase [Eubacteriales bacterium]
MYQIKTLNKIASVGTDILTQRNCTLGDDVANPQGILVRSANMHDYDFGSELVAIARAGAGTNNIPVSDCAEQGIVVFNTPGANAEAVKELAICALLMASRNVVGGARWAFAQQGKGTEIPKLVEKHKSEFVGPEITGKTLGVIGLGAIGAKIANAANDLGMEVYGYDPYLSVDAAWMLSRDVQHAVNVDKIYEKCDYITIHVPYMPATHHTINSETIAMMKDGVRILNLARGELVDDEAMKVALESGKVAKYVTDFPNETILSCPNVIPMPHLGASTPESEDKCAVMAAKELYDYLDNGNIKNAVNMPNVNLPRMGEARLCVVHKNVPKMLNKILEFVADQNINVEHMINKSKGEYAYTMMDVSSKIDDTIKAGIESMAEVKRVRVI